MEPLRHGRIAVVPDAVAAMDEAGAVAALDALAQRMRLRVFRALVGAGPAGLTPGALSARLGVPASTLSFHLKALMQAGLASHVRDGRNLVYRPSIDRMNALLAYLTAHCCHGAVCDIGPPAASGPAVRSGQIHCPAGESGMNDRVYEVLFVCTGNSARSIMAEGILNRLGAGRFRAHSAGSHPAGTVHPQALQTLAQMRMPTEGYRSKNWQEFALPGAPAMDFVFTVCDSAAGEVCPVWPGQPMTAHWGVPDPARFEGTGEQVARVFLDTAMVLRRRIEFLMVLPLRSLDGLAIRHEIRDIGQR
jgi:protein-tyrosine-phosphatase/DNA-binding transcriptional ArsR family regulator